MIPIFHPLNRVQWLDTLPKNLVMAEIGVFQGEFSRQILRRCNPQWLYLVDLFRGHVRSGDENGQNMTTANLDEVYGTLHYKLEHEHFNASLVSVVRDCSWSWLMAHVHCLDWIYIDTSHEYEPTLLELFTGYQAVRPGGILSGHDYCSATTPGVVKAVNYFCRYYDLQLNLLTGDRLPSFWIQKPPV